LEFFFQINSDYEKLLMSASGQERHLPITALRHSNPVAYLTLILGLGFRN